MAGVGVAGLALGGIGGFIGGKKVEQANGAKEKEDIIAAKDEEVH